MHHVLSGLKNRDSCFIFHTCSGVIYRYLPIFLQNNGDLVPFWFIFVVVGYAKPLR